MWALDSGSSLSSIRHNGAVTAAEFVDNGRLFAAGALDGTVLLAETEGGRILAQLPHDAPVVHFTLLDVKRLATVTVTGRIRVWDLRVGATAAEPTRLIPSRTQVVRLLPDGTTAFTCGDEGASRVSLASASTPRSLGTDANCLSVDVSAEGLLVATGYANGSTRLWSSSGEAFAPKLPNSAGNVLVGFLPEARHVLSVDAEGVVRVWDLTPAVPPVQVSRPFTWIGSFSPDGRRIVLGTGSTSFPDIGYATVVDAVTLETLVPPLRHGGNVRSAAFSADGRLIATASDDGSARLWDTATGEAVSRPLRDSRQVKEVVLSPDRQRLLTRGFAEDVGARPASLWDVSSGRVLATVPEGGPPYIGKFSPDAQHFLTVTRNPNRVQVWRSIDGQPVTDADWAGFTTAAFVSDSRVAMVGPDSVEVRSLDGTVVLRHAPGVRDADDLMVTADRSALLVSEAGGAIHVWSTIGQPRVASRRGDFPVRLPRALSVPITGGQWPAVGNGVRRSGRCKPVSH